MVPKSRRGRRSSASTPAAERAAAPNVLGLHLHLSGCPKNNDALEALRTSATDVIVGLNEARTSRYDASVDTLRIDRWLSAARIYKSRTVAQEACIAGHVKLNGTAVRPSHAIRVGDRVQARAPRGLVILEVRALAEKRQSPPLARMLYEDHSPPPPPREERPPARARGLGRPTKSDRRALTRFKGY
jgi:ribosome-associated heat shock protein Hsp15